MEGVLEQRAEIPINSVHDELDMPPASRLTEWYARQALVLWALIIAECQALA
jgi:hypothetical protein